MEVCGINFHRQKSFLYRSAAREVLRKRSKIVTASGGQPA
jgi:hypothetical protein